MKVDRAFLAIPGSKWQLARILVKLLPPHRTYVEVFGGGANLLFRKPLSEVEVYNDIDGNLVNLFRVVRDEEKFRKFARKVYWTLYSREEFHYAVNRENSRDIDDIERAWCTWISTTQGYGGRKAWPTWSYAINKGQIESWHDLNEKLEIFHQRLRNVQIENLDFRDIIPRYDTAETLFYLDPPYYPKTREAIIYVFEFSKKDYDDLFNILLKVKGKVMLSGYYHPAFDVLENAGWKRLDFKVRTSCPNANAVDKEIARAERIESVWLNYEPPTQINYLDFEEEE